MTLRARLLLALAYVLVLAIGSMLVPLVRSVSSRIDAEVKTQALGQAEVVAATAGRGVRPRRARRDVRARGARAGADRRPGAARSSPTPSPAAWAPTTRRARRSRPRCAASPTQVTRDSETLGEPILATAVPIVRDGRTDGAVRVTQSVDAVGRAVRSATIGLVLVGLIVLALGLAAGALPGGLGHAAAAAAGVRRAARGRGRPLGARAGRGVAGAAGGRGRVQRDDRRACSGWSTRSATSSPTPRTSCGRR